MIVEILKLDSQAAKCRVTDDSGNATVFYCGLGTPAHEALQHIVRNAALRLAEIEANRQLSIFASVHG